MFDNAKDREGKVRMEVNGNYAEKKTNLTFLGRSCGIFLGGDGCQVRSICQAYYFQSSTHQTMFSFSGRVQEWKTQNCVQELLQYGRLQQGVADQQAPHNFRNANNVDACYDISLNILMIIK